MLLGDAKLLVLLKASKRWMPGCFLPFFPSLYLVIKSASFYFFSLGCFFIAWVGYYLCLNAPFEKQHGGGYSTICLYHVHTCSDSKCGFDRDREKSLKCGNRVPYRAEN